MGGGIGFLYTLTESITPALIIFIFYFLLVKSKNAISANTKNFYIIFVFYLASYCARPV
jgi:hypothetical protein